MNCLYNYSCAQYRQFSLECGPVVSVGFQSIEVFNLVRVQSGRVDFTKTLHA